MRASGSFGRWCQEERVGEWGYKKGKGRKLATVQFLAGCCCGTSCSTLMENLEIKCRTQLRDIPPKGQGNRGIIHQLPSMSSQKLLTGVLTLCHFQTTSTMSHEKTLRCRVTNICRSCHWRILECWVPKPYSVCSRKVVKSMGFESQTPHLSPASATYVW